MFQDLQHGWSFVRIKGQSLRDEVECIWRYIDEPIFSILLLYLCQDIQHLLAELGLKRLKILYGGWSSPCNDSLDLVERRIAWKHGFSHDDFTEHASKTPHISGFRVFFGAEQNLRRPIPSGGDIFSEIGWKIILFFLKHRPHQSEIANLSQAVFIDQNIRRLYISMDKLSSVKIVDRFSSLVYDVSFVLLAEHVLSNEGVKVDIHVLEQNVYVFFVHRANHFPRLYDIGVVEFFQVHYLAEGALCIR